MRKLLLVVLLSLLSWRASAQPATLELAINGPQGALLIIDGQAFGKLPLPVNPVVRVGPHRFRLELGKQRAESDTLSLPDSGHAELNLTLAGSSLIAVLRITDGLLLLLEPETLPTALRGSITAAVAAAARQEHSVLLGTDNQAALLRRQSVVSRCIDSGDCHESLFRDARVSYVLSLRVENADASSPGSCRLRAALLDVRTRDLSAQAEESCRSAAPSSLSAQTFSLIAKLLQETAIRPRGAITVTSAPAGAKVLLDGRWLGMTPLSLEAFAGQRMIEVQSHRYLPHKSTVQIEPNQTAAVDAVLLRDPSAALARPPWRIVTGSILLGGGLLLVGFGASALASNGQCQDGSTNFDTCTPYYGTAAIGGGLLGTGAALTIAGTLMLAIPSRATSR